jgi:hypothetical protein
VFGVPSMEVRDALFWGYDHFPYLEQFSRAKICWIGPIAKVVHDSTVIGSQALSIQNRGRLTPSVPSDLRASLNALGLS